MNAVCSAAPQALVPELKDLDEIKRHLLPLRILYVGMTYDYGKPERGLSYEQVNFFDSLVQFGHEVHQFDFMERQRVVGTDKMREELVVLAGARDYDIVFCALFTDEVDVLTLERVRHHARAPVVNWFADDHWRMEGFSLKVAPSLDWIITTFPDALPRYRESGFDNVILSQWACNHRLYRPPPEAVAGTISVSFVGAAYGDRPDVIKAIRRAGHDVQCWGSGWKQGRLDFPDMVEVFGRTNVNLNLAGSYRPTLLKSLILRAARKGGGREERPPQIKGRVFELAGCAAFQVTERVPHLERYFDLGTEMATYENTGDLVEQVTYWLNEPDARRLVAEAARRRVLREHTWDHRFYAVFGAMGLFNC